MLKEWSSQAKAFCRSSSRKRILSLWIEIRLIEMHLHNTPYLRQKGFKTTLFVWKQLLWRLFNTAFKANPFVWTFLANIPICKPKAGTECKSIDYKLHLDRSSSLSLPLIEATRLMTVTAFLDKIVLLACGAYPWLADSAGFSLKVVWVKRKSCFDFRKNCC